jgi:phage tail sheath protein FI
MPEYLAPGVYVEETSFRSKSIEGVSTTTTGFIGPCRYGPVELGPDILTSLGDFERVYGDRGQLDRAGKKTHNYLWHAARAFFTEGGRRLYVTRVFRPLDDKGATGSGATRKDASGNYIDGYARKQYGGVTIAARFPGAAGGFRVRLTLKAAINTLGKVQTGPTLGALADRDVVLIDQLGSPGSSIDFYLATLDTSKAKPEWVFKNAVGSPISSPLDATGIKVGDLNPSAEPAAGDSVRVLSLNLSVYGADGVSLGAWSGLPLDPAHRSAGVPDSIFNLFDESPEKRELPVVLSAAEDMDGLDVLDALFRRVDYARLSDAAELAKGINLDFVLEGGNDGQRPGIAEYEGSADESKSFKTGLHQLEDLEDISIVAAPGSTADYANFRDDANAITGLLLAHAQNMRYRIAVIDSAEGQSIGDVRKMRAKLDSTYGALYYPWVKVLDPVTRQTILLPPSGFVAGIYARNDINRAVYKAPANEVVNLALGFELTINKSQQEVLNPEGINCFRYFEGRGMLLWGARTISSDPEWKYVNLRRYFAYLERSIDKGTQWAVFEPNGERLWANVKRTLDDFLLNEWMNGALLGDKPEKSFFVKCDRGTMSQNDLDNGRLVCLIGVAALRPAEFVIFRIGQWTADRKV